jgi:hypothetical protein
MVRGHPRRGAERRSVTGIGGGASELGRLEVGDKADSRGPVVREMRGTARPVGWLGQRPSRPRGRPGRKSGKRNF